MKAFISYSHRDEARRERLNTHLAVLRREGRVEEWFDRKILAGGGIDPEIDERIEWCDLFLPLVSPDFLASDYCYEREMTIALERHDANEARVVPIIVEPCDWKNTPLGRLKAVPCDGHPIALWDNENDAYLDVVKELRRIVTAHEAQRAGHVRASYAGMTETDHLGSVISSSRPTAGPGALQGTGLSPHGRVGGNLRIHRPDGTLVKSATGERAHERSTTRRYRRKRDFDEIDRAEFREAAFAAIREHFEREIGELTALGDVRGRLVPRSETSFSCTVVNKAMQRGTAHITVHSRSGEGVGVGDISYSFQENSPPGQANGFFTIEHDEYELYLQSIMMMFGHDRNRLTPQEAAETIWGQFIEQAGISYG